MNKWAQKLSIIWLEGFNLFVFVFLKLGQVSSFKEAENHSLGPRYVTLSVRAISLTGSGEFCCAQATDWHQEKHHPTQGWASMSWVLRFSHFLASLFFSEAVTVWIQKVPQKTLYYRLDSQPMALSEMAEPLQGGASKKVLDYWRQAVGWNYTLYTLYHNMVPYHKPKCSGQAVMN